MPSKSPVCTERAQQTLLASRSRVSERLQREGLRDHKAGRLGKDSEHFGLVSLWEMTGQSFTLSTSINDPASLITPNAVAIVRITSLTGISNAVPKIEETTLMAETTTSTVASSKYNLDWKDEKEQSR